MTKDVPESGTAVPKSGTIPGRIGMVVTGMPGQKELPKDGWWKRLTQKLKRGK